MGTVRGSDLLLLLFLIASGSTFISTASQPLMAAEQHQQLDRIIQAMIGNGDFRHWAADFLSAVNDQFGIPLSATLFIPDGYDPTAADIAADISRFSMAYHIVPQRLSFSDLCHMDRFSRLPTLLPGNSILITDNSASNFTVDGTLVSDPDLFVSSAVVIHGIASPLDFSIYGGYSGGDSSLANSLLPRDPGGTSGRGVSGSNSAARFPRLLVVMAVVSGIFAVKILF